MQRCSLQRRQSRLDELSKSRSAASPRCLPLKTSTTLFFNTIPESFCQTARADCNAGQYTANSSVPLLRQHKNASPQVTPNKCISQSMYRYSWGNELQQVCLLNLDEIPHVVFRFLATSVEYESLEDANYTVVLLYSSLAYDNCSLFQAGKDSVHHGSEPSFVPWMKYDDTFCLQ